VGILDKIKSFDIFSVQINRALVHKKINAVRHSVDCCVEDWGLHVTVDVVWIASGLDQTSNNSNMPFSSSVEKWGLSKAINMVRLATVS